MIAMVLALFAAGCSSGTASPGPASTSGPPTTSLLLPPVATTTSTTLPPTPTTLPDFPQPDPAPPLAGQGLALGTTGAAVVARGGADLFGEIDGEALMRAHEGLVFPATGRAGEGRFLEVLTPCNDIN